MYIYSIHVIYICTVHCMTSCIYVMYVVGNRIRVQMKTRRESIVGVVGIYIVLLYDIVVYSVCGEDNVY